jgi:hypothetical protein
MAVAELIRTPSAGALRDGRTQKFKTLVGVGVQQTKFVSMGARSVEVVGNTEKPDIPSPRMPICNDAQPRPRSTESVLGVRACVFRDTRLRGSTLAL